MIIEDYNKSIKKIEENIKIYDDFDEAKHEFLRLKNLYDDDKCEKCVNKLIYEINFLSFYIDNGELHHIFQQDDNLNLFIEAFDNDCINYLKMRFQKSKNKLLKSLYSLILSRIKSKNKLSYLHSFIDLTMEVYFETKSLKDENFSEFLSVCLINAYVNAVSKNYPKKDEIIQEIDNFIHDDSQDIFSKINLMEFLFSKKDYKNFDITGMDTLCWNFAQSCNQELDSIAILELGKKVSNKLQKERYDWDNEIGKNYESLMFKKTDFLIKQRFCKKAINYYKNSKNQEKIEELIKYLEKIQNESEFHPAPFLDIHPSFFIHIDLRLIKLIRYSSKNLIENLIKSDENLPNLDYNNLTLYNNVKISNPLFMDSSKEVFDSNYNNRLSDKEDGDETKKAELFYNFVHSMYLQSYMKIYLDSVFEFVYVNNLFNYKNLIEYLEKYTYLDDETLKYLKPAISSYFNQLDLYLTGCESNFVLFMDSIISKIEAIIRQICKENGIVTTDVYYDSVSEKITLEKIFKMVDFKNIFSNSDYNFLKIVLTDEGINMRNELSHGLNYGKYSFSNANLLMFCFLRLIKYIK